MGSTHRLAIDLGTCHTVAVVQRKNGPARALLFDGTPLLPSGVFAREDGQILVGRDAQRMLQTNPGRFEPYPKRQIDGTAVLLGDTEVPVVDLYSAILGRVAAEARDAGVDPATGTVLTCPADWGPHRRKTLVAAATAAGFGTVTLIDEPVAAATYCQSVLDQRIPLGQCVAIFDFGGGTLDVTVVRQEATGLQVLAVGGLDDLGGVDCDAALAGHLSQAIGWRNPDVLRRLEHPSTQAEHRDRLAYWAEVRAAKEMLSRSSSAPVSVPGMDEAIHLTREELDRVVRPLIDRAVDETRRVLQRAAVTTPASARSDRPASESQGTLAGIFLVGGASRMPLVASRLHARFQVAPTVPEQPELPVAFGALIVADERSAPEAQLPPIPTAPPPPVVESPTPTPAPPSAPPVSPGAPFVFAAGGTSVFSAPRPGTPAAPGSPAPGFPTAGSPAPGFPTAGGAGTQQSHSDSWPGAKGPFPPFTDLKVPPKAPPGRPAKSTGRKPLRVLLALVLLVPGYFVVKAVTESDVWQQAFEQGVAGANGSKTGGGASLKPVASIPIPTGHASAMTTSGDAFYYAVAGTDTTDVFAVAIAGGAQRWTTKLRVASGTMSLRAVGDLLVVTALRVPTNNNDDVRAVLDAKTGAMKWSASWPDLLDIAYLGTDVLVQRQSGTRTSLERIDLVTGNPRWQRTPVSDMYIIDSRISKPSLVGTPSSQTTGLPAANTDFDATYPQQFSVDPTLAAELAESAERLVVTDAANGTQKISGKAPLKADNWTVFNGLAIGQRDDVDTAMSGYRLSDAKQAWEYRIPAGMRFDDIRPCGRQLVCASVEVSSGPDYLVALDVASGAEKWRYGNDKSTPQSMRWTMVGERLLVGDGASTSLSSPVLLDPGTGQKTATLGTLTSGGSAWTVSGTRVLTVGIASSGHWLATVIDAGSGKAIGSGDSGKDYPKSATLSGTAFAVLGADSTIRLFALPHSA